MAGSCKSFLKKRNLFTTVFGNNSFIIEIQRHLFNILNVGGVCMCVNIIFIQVEQMSWHALVAQIVHHTKGFLIAHKVWIQSVRIETLGKDGITHGVESSSVTFVPVMRSTQATCGWKSFSKVLTHFSDVDLTDGIGSFLLIQTQCPG